MVALMRLPQYNPGNQLIDLSPINQGFASIQQRRQTDIQNRRADEQLGMQRDQFGMQKQQFEAQQKAQQVKTLANRASVISGLPEGQRQAAWQRMVQASPQLATALQENGVDPNDHVAGPRMIIAEAGQYDPMGDKLKQAQLAKMGMDVKLTNAQLAQMKNQTPEYRAMIAEKYGLKPGTPEHRMFVLQGQLPSKTGPDASTMKHIFTSQDELPDLKGSIEALEEARSLLGSMYHGRGSQTRSSINQSLPGLNIISDPLKAKNTQRFYQIMNEQAINKMSAALKGSTTNQEMMEFKEMIADPNVSPETKQKTIETMLARARRHLQIKSQRIRDLGGQVPIDPAPQQPHPGDGAGAGAGWSATRVK